MLRLLSPKAQGREDFWKPSKPFHVGIHWLTLAEYSQICQGFIHFQVFASFYNGQISHQQHNIRANPHVTGNFLTYHEPDSNLGSAKRMQQAASDNALPNSNIGAGYWDKLL